MSPALQAEAVQGPGGRAVRWSRTLAAFWPPYLVALLLLPFIISGGQFWPWRPATIDLDVYVYAVRDMLAGRDIYQTLSPGWNLTFIYPPIAAVLMVPLAVGPYALWQLVWTAATVAAQQYVLARCGGPAGWRLGLLGAAVVIGVEPIRTTLGYGQVNTVLMFLVVADLLGRVRRIPPQGTWIGLATAIKLTPALFAVFTLVTGRWKITLRAFLAFLGFTLFGAIFQPRQTYEFWFTLAGGDTRAPSGPIYVGNQSVLGVTSRLLGESTVDNLLGLACGAIVALLAVFVARSFWLHGNGTPDRAVALGLVGLATCLASPLSWTHHHVWVLPLGVGLLTGTSLPAWARRVGLFWVVWIALCLPLALLPYGDRREADYSWWQDLIGNLGPITGCVLIVGLAIGLIRDARSRPDAEPAHALDQAPVPGDRGRPRRARDLLR